jgi:glutamine amidotransferase-like uncharacterized protein
VWLAAPVAVCAGVLLVVLLAVTGYSQSGPGGPAQILLFNGTGASSNDVAAVERILREKRFNYSTVNSRELNGMSQSQLMAYRLMIIPGGNFITMGTNLTTNATANIHNAVQGGLNYLGICAGGFLAGHGHGYYNSLDLASGARFRFYSAENRGVRKAAVPIACAGTLTLEHYWEDGPEFSGWGAVVGKYPDGAPAIVEGTSGKGRVILCGVHPEAPENWRGGMSFNTPASDDNAFAGTLIDAALQGTVLSHY